MKQENTQKEQEKADPPLFDALRPVQRAAFLGFMCPLLVIVLVLKTLRLDDPYITREWYVWPDLYVSDLCFFGFVSAACLALLGVRHIAKVALPFVQLVYVIWFFFELVGYRFYFTTGSVLDWPLIVTYIKYVKQLWGMVSLTNSTLSRLMLGGVVSLFFALPWLVLWRMKRGEDRTALTTPRVRQRTLLVIAAVCLPLAILFPIGSKDRRIGQNTMIAIAESAMHHIAQGQARRDAPRERFARTLTRREEIDKPRPVILILLESTRASVTSPYNPRAEKVTPNLSAIAAKGTTLSHAFAVVPHTSKALFTVHCGTYPSPMAPLTEAGRDGIKAPCLPELLAQQGYETGLFQGATLLFESNHSLLMNAGYETMMGAEDLEPTPFERMNYFGYEARAILEPVSAWLDNLPKDKPFLLTTMTLAPHHDYQLPKGYELRQLHEDETFNRYLNAVAYTDTWIAELLALLEERGLLQQSVVAIVGDHGEAFGEHGRNYHDNVIYQEALHIPMLLMGPGVPKGERLDTPASQLDLLPTLAHLAGFRLDGPADGVNVLATTEAEREAANSRQLVSYCWYERACAALIDWPYKFVHHFGNQPDELFHLIHDPLERDNLLMRKEADDDALAAKYEPLLLEQLGEKARYHGYFVEP